MFDALLNWVLITLTANAWEEGDEVVLITCRIEKPDLDMVNGSAEDRVENFSNERERTFNTKL